MWDSLIFFSKASKKYSHGKANYQTIFACKFALGVTPNILSILPFCSHEENYSKNVKSDIVLFSNIYYSFEKKIFKLIPNTQMQLWLKKENVY